MLRPRIRTYRDRGDYGIQFNLERPNGTRKVFSQIEFGRHKYSDGFGVRGFIFEIKVFDN